MLFAIVSIAFSVEFVTKSPYRPGIEPIPMFFNDGKDNPIEFAVELKRREDEKKAVEERQKALAIQLEKMAERDQKQIEALNQEIENYNYRRNVKDIAWYRIGVEDLVQYFNEPFPAGVDPETIRDRRQTLEFYQNMLIVYKKEFVPIPGRNLENDIFVEMMKFKENK